MTDPEVTPEERNEDWFTGLCRDPESVKAYLAEQKETHDNDLRSAVSAETERCASVDPASVLCPLEGCDAAPLDNCTNPFDGALSPFHAGGWRDAIREGGRE